MARFLGIGNGQDGVIALGSYTQIKASCSGSSGATSLSATGSFSAGQRLFICQMRGTGVGAYEDNQVASYVAGTITLVHPLQNTYTDSGASQAQVVVVPQASSVTGSFTLADWDGDVGGLFVIACSGVFSGTITATGAGYIGGASVLGVVGGAGQAGKQGEGSTASGGTQSTSANTDGGGGGGVGADGGGGGGGGGYGASGSNGEAGQGTGGTGGTALGQAEITSLFMGGGGGSGAGESNDNEGPHTSGAGGNGGGIIVVYSNNISSSASLVANGDNGGNFSGHTGIDSSGTGGGGAGGSILIKGTTVDVSGTVTASGGTAISNAFSGGAGGDGAVGRIRIEGCSITGSTTPSASESEGGHSWCGNAALIF